MRRTWILDRKAEKESKKWHKRKKGVKGLTINNGQQKKEKRKKGYKYR
jgi:hypothetical protein